MAEESLDRVGIETGEDHEVRGERRAACMMYSAFSRSSPGAGLTAARSDQWVGAGRGDGRRLVR